MMKWTLLELIITPLVIAHTTSPDIRVTNPIFFLTCKSAVIFFPLGKEGGGVPSSNPRSCCFRAYPPGSIQGEADPAVTRTDVRSEILKLCA